MLLDEQEQWQQGLIESLERNQQDGLEIKKMDKLLTIKNAIRPDLIDHEYYHNPQNIGEIMSEERKREWKSLQYHRIDAPKILSQLKTHLTRGEKIPEELCRKAEQILKKPIFDELKSRGLLHEEYIDNPTVFEKKEIEPIEEKGYFEKNDTVRIIRPEELNEEADLMEDDFFALEDESILNPKKNCEFCFCKGIMPELHPMNVHLLLHFMSPGGRILSRRQTGLCAKWQRKVSSTIRRAKHLGIFSYKKSKYYINFPFESSSTTAFLNERYQKTYVYGRKQQEEPSIFPTSDEEKPDLQEYPDSQDEYVNHSDGNKRDALVVTEDESASSTSESDRRDSSANEEEMQDKYSEEDDEGANEEEEDEVHSAGEEEEEKLFSESGDEFEREFDPLAEEIPRRRSSKELDLTRSNNYNLILNKIKKN